MGEFGRRCRVRRGNGFLHQTFRPLGATRRLRLRFRPGPCGSTVEDVMKFVKLTDVSGDTVHVNLEQVISMAVYGDRTRLLTPVIGTNNTPFAIYVTETPEQIKSQVWAGQPL